MKKVSVQFNLMGVAPSGAKMKHGQRRIIPATPNPKARPKQMIPTIEQICDDLKSGSISLEQAITWLLIHAQTQFEVDDNKEGV